MTESATHDGLVDVRSGIDRAETDLFESTWRQDHDEAMECCTWEELIAKLNGLFERLDVVDTANHIAWGRDVPGCEEVDELLSLLSKRWLALAEATDLRVSRFAQKGCAVKRLDELRKLIVEVKAFLNPSYEIKGGMLKILEQAIAENARGETLEGLVDSHG